MDEETLLIEQARKGGEEAFERLVGLHQGRVRAFLGRYVRNRDMVDDLAQEVFFSAYRTVSSYQGDSPFAIWLIGIARHRALTYLRGESRRKARESAGLSAALAGWQAEYLGSTSGDSSREERRLSALTECMKQIPDPSASVMNDYYFAGHSAAGIARTLGKKENVVRMMLLRTRQLLRRCIDQRLAAQGSPS